MEFFKNLHPADKASVSEVQKPWILLHAFASKAANLKEESILLNQVLQTNQ